MNILLNLYHKSNRIVLISICCIISFVAQAQRNVILIIADDLGTDYCGFYENYGDTVNMPNIRRLLDKGVRFTNAMSNPLCSPTRAGILTGRYSFRTGVGSSIDNKGALSLDTSEMSIPKLLNLNAPNAIATAQIGKWHLNTDTPATNLLIPNVMGYDYYSGNFKALVWKYYHWTKITNGVSQIVTNYATTETANDAIAWIKSQNSNPFFLWLAFNAPHEPYHLPPANLHSYSGLSGTQADIDSNPKLYFKATVEAMDHEIGRLFDSLQTFNKFDSTEIIFISDNGNSKLVCQNSLDSLRSKGTIYINGNHVPFIISGPSVVNPGRASAALVNTQDLFATIIELAGDTGWQSQIPPNKPVDSKSLMPILKNNASTVRPWSFTELFKAKDKSNDGKTIRNMDYNLLHFDNGKKEFYNLKNDPNEITNLLDTFMTDSEIVNYNYLCDQMTTLVGDTSGCNAVIKVTQTITNVMCYGASTGKINLQVTGAKSPYTYLWNSGTTTKNRTGLSAGTYVVTISDANQQSRTISFKISQPPKINIMDTVTLTVCGGNIAVTPKGGRIPYSYIWNNGSTNSILSNVSPGNYIVTITDNNGCNKVDTVLLTNPNALALSQSQTNVFCNSFNNGTATVIPTGGTPVYTYQWSNGQTTQTATGLTSASYSVQVTDLNGCSLVRNFNITQTNPLVTTVSKTNPLCNNTCDGSAIAFVTSGGIIGLTYNWSNGFTTQSISSLCSGTYTLTMSNVDNCTSSTTTAIIAPAALAGSANPQLSCSNPGNGVANTIISGGTPPYTYLWSNGQTTGTATGLISGNYNVTVNDANGCVIQLTIPLIVSPPIFATTTSTNPTCSANQGSINVAISGGQSPFQYQWNTGATSSSISNLTGGTYTVSVTDNAGCTLSSSTILTVTGNIPNKPGAISGPKMEVCAGSTNVGYSIAPVNNSNSYLWTAPANASIISGQGTNSILVNYNTSFNSGKLTVAAVNYCGSSTSKSLTIQSHPPTPGSITGPISVCANQTNVAYSIAPVNGATTYKWSKPPASVFVSGQGTTNIILNFGNIAGHVNVKAGNTCGYSGTKSRQVSISCKEFNNESEMLELSLYPNPTDDIINVSFNSDLNEKFRMQLEDALGKVVYSSTGTAKQSFSNITINVRSLSAGLYFFVFELNGTKYTRKIAIE